MTITSRIWSTHGALAGGTLVAVILLLNGTVRDLIGLLGTGRSRHLVVDEEGEVDDGGHGTVVE